MMKPRQLNGWLTVFAGFLGSAAGAGVVALYVFGIFIKAVAAEYDWSRSVATIGTASFFIMSGIGSVILGSAMARWSVRSVTLVFVLLFAASLAAVAILPNSVPLFIVTFALAGVFGSAATMMPYAIAISGWFGANRGLALAVAVSGAAASGLFMSIYANWLMENWGWRGGYIGVAVLVGLVSAVALILFYRTPPTQAAPSASEPQVKLRQIWIGDRAFWLLALPIFLISVALAGVITSLPPALNDRGMPMAEAAAMMSIVAGSSAVSRLAVGLLLDRLHARIVAAAIFMISGLGAAIFIWGWGGFPLYAGLVCIGLGLGSEADLVTYSVSRYFGPRALSRALAGVWICWAWGSALGTALGSASYDIFGNYDVAFACFAAIGVLSAMIVLRLGAYRFADGHADREEGGGATS